MVSDDSRLKKVFPLPPMICYRRGKNLREVICRAKLPPARARRTDTGFKRCRKAACSLCPYTGLRQGQILKSVKVSSTGEELPVRGSITCQTPNILYLGTCTKNDRVCPEQPQYCGETGKTAEERFVGHRNTIVQACHQGSHLPVSEHFQGPGHNISDFRFTPIEKIYSSNIFVRKAREKHMINQLNLIDNGLNKKL